MKRFRRTFEQIWQAFSGEAAWQTVADLSRFHRIQASPGYRQAAQLLHRRLVGDGLDAEILSFSADERTAFWACPSFQEWDCAGATLHLVAPAEEAGLLADFRACPISLIQRSAPFDGEAEVVLLELDAGEGEADYDGPDVAGKVVLSRGDLRRVWELAVAQRGAVGILFDGMRAVKPVRPEGDLADPEEERQAAGLVPTRRVRGPISIQDPGSSTASGRRGSGGMEPTTPGAPGLAASYPAHPGPLLGRRRSLCAGHCRSGAVGVWQARRRAPADLLSLAGKAGIRCLSVGTWHLLNKWGKRRCLGRQSRPQTPHPQFAKMIRSLDEGERYGYTGDRRRGLHRQRRGGRTDPAG